MREKKSSKIFIKGYKTGNIYMISPRAYQKWFSDEVIRFYKKTSDGYADEFNGETNYPIKNR